MWGKFDRTMMRNLYLIYVDLSIRDLSNVDLINVVLSTVKVYTVDKC